MITLPKLVISDTDISSAQTGTTTGTAEGAQDFFALLAGAMSGHSALQDKLTLADLQAAKQKLPQGEAKTTLDTLLARQQESVKHNVDLTTLTDAQSLLNALTPDMKSGVVKQLAKALSKDDEQPTLNQEEMAGLSALMAMLPHTAPTSMAQSATVAASGTPVNTTGVEGIADKLTTATAIGTADPQDPNGKALPPGMTTSGLHAAQTDSAAANQTTPLIAPPATRAETESALSAATPAVTVAPVISNATATVNTHPVVTVNSQLGTPEWQQNVSQHITLFTRQGQQTAELKLHPENLGQVNITLKMDDNQAQIQMVSPHSHVRAALEAAIPTLRIQLADNGIQLAQSNVSSDSFAGQQQHSAFSQHSSQHSAEGRGFTGDEEETLIVPASLQAQIRGNGTVDTFA